MDPNQGPLSPHRTPRFASYNGEPAPGNLNRWSDQAIENFIEETRIQQSMQLSMLTSAHTRTRFAFGTGIAAFIVALRPRRLHRVSECRCRVGGALMPGGCGRVLRSALTRLRFCGRVRVVGRVASCVGPAGALLC